MVNFEFEKQFLKQIEEISHNKYFAIGVDEVGRGPLAGCVVACALIFKESIQEEHLALINDSKKLSAKKREEIFKILQEFAYFEIQEVSVEIIDKINILQASIKAMEIACENLLKKVEAKIILVDGNQQIKTSIANFNLVKGDSKSITIAAASIVAKVYRDNLMKELAKKYPFYLWEKNAGYGTKAHLEAIEKYGITKHHRKSFAPIKKHIN